ncbi:DUF3793 family protein [Romboutsia weinsteinii]|uniref:DUF3793 family protein n=1 Tax=Romboutsia weinsteinii TaxID=2020949 RepID=A0A371J6M1_9FIRM|nr:DUF3793 family protein [Romboutsia weinsteinii]RDY28402.1 DUF3793 family protein [Romboutsia weinsteinii]
MNLTCNISNCTNKLNSSYIKRILGMLGPVILGSKPSEIINISGKDIQRHEKLGEIHKLFDSCSKLTYYVIETLDGGFRILFINEKSLSIVLRNKKCINFLKFLGYPSQSSLSLYVEVLVNKLQSEDFPDEIGIFLGYPIKDVIGFMGFGKYDFYKTMAWRIYGDPSVSYEVYNSFIRDKDIMKKMVESNSIEDLKQVI